MGKEGTGPESREGVFRGIFLDVSHQGPLPLAAFTGPGGGGGGRSLEGKSYNVCPWTWRLVLGEWSSAAPPPPRLDPSVQLSSESGSLSEATFLRPVFRFIAPLAAEMSAP